MGVIMKQRPITEIILHRDKLLEDVKNLNDFLLPYENKKLPMKSVTHSKELQANFVDLRDRIAQKIENTLGTNLDPDGKSFINGYANGVLDSIRLIRTITEKELKEKK